MEALAPFVVYATVVKKLTDLAKEFLPNSIPNKAVQGIAWVIAIGMAFVFAQADYIGDQIRVINDITLQQLDAWGVVIYGLAAGASAGVLNDAIERRNPDAAPDKP